MQITTLCYIEQDGKYLMLHRTVKENDVNQDKWIGVGGHFEADESPEECLLREETCYMRDYIRDDSDRITQIRFDRVDPVPEGYHGGTNFSGTR